MACVRDGILVFHRCYRAISRELESPVLEPRRVCSHTQSGALGWGRITCRRGEGFARTIGQRARVSSSGSVAMGHRLPLGRRRRPEEPGLFVAAGPTYLC